MGTSKWWRAVAVEGGSCAAAGATMPAEQPAPTVPPVDDVSEEPVTHTVSAGAAKGRGATLALTLGPLAVPFLVMLALSGVLTRRRRAQIAAT